MTDQTDKERAQDERDRENFERGRREGLYRSRLEVDQVKARLRELGAELCHAHEQRDNAVSVARELGADVADLESYPPELTVEGDLTVTALPSLKLRAERVEALAERDAARQESGHLREALDRATRIAALMSNVCWSLGHPDREVQENRAALAKLAKDWDEFRSGIGALLTEAPTGETEDGDATTKV